MKNNTHDPFSQERIAALVDALVAAGISAGEAGALVLEAFSLGRDAEAEARRQHERNRKRRERAPEYRLAETDSRQAVRDNSKLGNQCPGQAGMSGTSRGVRDSPVGGTIGGVLANGREKVEEVEVCTSPAPTPVKQVPPDPTPEIDTRSPFEKFPILTDPVFLGLTPADDEVEL